MVILASEEREIGYVKDANLVVDINNRKTFSLQIARTNWQSDLTFANYIYVPDEEFGGIIGEMLTDTSLDYVELRGFTWRGMLEHKIIEPPEGSAYKTVSGELHSVLNELIYKEFGGLFVVSTKDTGVVVTDYQFERYCTLLSGIKKMLKSVGYRLKLSHKRERGTPGYVLVEAVRIVDYSDKIEFSKDCRINYTLNDKRNGVNHLIVAGKGELQERNVFHLYYWPDNSIKEEPYYTGRYEIAMLYENTFTESEELRIKAEEKFREIVNRQSFTMDVAKLEIENIGIGDIVGGRDYLTGLYAAKAIENIIFSITNGEISKVFKLEGESKE